MNSSVLSFVTGRRYASRHVSVSLSVRYTPVLYQNG